MIGRNSGEMLVRGHTPDLIQSHSQLTFIALSCETADWHVTAAVVMKLADATAACSVIKLL